MFVKNVKKKTCEKNALKFEFGISSRWNLQMLYFLSKTFFVYFDLKANKRKGRLHVGAAL